MEDSIIPFNRPFLPEGALKFVEESFSNRHTSGGGRHTRECEKILEAGTGAGRAMLVTSCTHALEMCALLLGIQPGDEVIIPSFTFVSTASAFVMRGARPVFLDIREDTLNIDETLLAAAITPRTKAIVVVHYAGVACEMNAILEIAGNHGIPVVEDNAHGLFGTYHGRPLGSFGCLSTQSFHETKNISCGEGGALLLNDPTLVATAEIIRDKGTNRGQFMRGEVQKYTWVELGSSYVISDILAGILKASLLDSVASQESRTRIWNAYARELAPWAEKNGVRLPVIPEHVEHPSHLFYLLVPSPGKRDALIQHLAARKITATFHYLPLNESEMALRLGAGAECPVSGSVSRRILRLPLYNYMSDEELDRVLSGVTSFGGFQ